MIALRVIIRNHNHRIEGGGVETRVLESIALPNDHPLPGGDAPTAADGVIGDVGQAVGGIQHGFNAIGVVIPQVLEDHAKDAVIPRTF